jgi:hypothetical protein
MLRSLFWPIPLPRATALRSLERKEDAYCQSHRSDRGMQDNMSVQSVIAVFGRVSEAEEAIYELNRRGFPIEQVSILSQRLQSEKEMHGYIVAADRTGDEMDGRIWKGGLFSLLSGAAFVWSPHSGPLIVGGPLATALLDGVERAGPGAAGRGLLNVLIGWRVSRKFVVKYRDALKAGKYLVIVRGSVEEGREAQDVLRNAAADELHVHEKEIGLARFIARDPEAPAIGEEELEELIPKLRGAIDWTIHPDGDVILEYDRTRNSDEIIEEALTSLGFRLKHIYDHPVTDEIEVEEALEQ